MANKSQVKQINNLKGRKTQDVKQNVAQENNSFNIKLEKTKLTPKTMTQRFPVVLTCDPIR